MFSLPFTQRVSSPKFFSQTIICSSGFQKKDSEMSGKFWCREKQLIEQRTQTFPPQLKKCSHNRLFNKSTASSFPVNLQTTSFFHHHSSLAFSLESRDSVCFSMLKEERFWCCPIMPVCELSVDSTFQPSATISGLKALIQSKYFQTHDRSPCGKQRDLLFCGIFLPKNLKVNFRLSVPKCVTAQKESQAACLGHSLHFSDISPFLLSHPPRVQKVPVHSPLLVCTPQRHWSPLRAHLQTQEL